MNCPKCAGGAFLSEEDLVKLMDTAQPMKMIVKQTFVCRACSEKFSRIVWDDFESRRKTGEIQSAGVQTVSLTQQQPQQQSQPSSDHAASGIQFLDRM